MRALPVQSAGRRFVQKFGFAFLWAAFFGTVFGGLVYYRAPRAASSDSDPRFGWARSAFDRLELLTYDWRARELGAQSTRSDSVVMVGIDDEALASAREDTSHVLGGYPWPREVLGGLSEQLIREGGRLALLDLPFADLSPRGCAAGSDDQQFRARLDRLPQRTLLTFGWSAGAPPRAERELRPAMLLVGDHASFDEAREDVRKILVEQAPAYLVPDGKRFQLWAAAASETKAKELGDALGLASPRTVRQRLASEQGYEVPAWRLLASFAEVEVPGLDVTRLPLARSLEAPAAPLLSEKSLYGAQPAAADHDGTVRGVSQLVYFAPPGSRGFLLPTAPLAAAMQVTGSRKLAFADGRLSIGGQLSIPMDETGFSLIRWDAAEAGRGARGSLKRSMSVWKVLVNLWDHEQRRGVAHHDNELTGRVAVVADASSHSAQPRATPIGPVPGAALVGQALVNLLRADGITRVAPEVDLLATFGMALAGALLTVLYSALFKARSGLPSATLCVAVLGTAWVFVARTLFVNDQEWVAIAGPLAAASTTFFAATGYASAIERRFREFVTSALGRYVHPEVARRVESDIGLMHPERRAVTFYVADLVGFGTAAAELPPEQVVALLREVFSEVSQCIARAGGHVDKYVGDSVTAFWGAPVRLEHHARSACGAALNVDRVIEGRRAAWEKTFGRKVQVCAGLASGEVVAGDMGSEVKANYTVVGEPVGLAARLESAGRRYGVRILASDATYEGARGPYVFREVDRVRWNANGPVERVHELVGRVEDLGPERAKQVAAFLEALGAYHARRFSDAEAGFARCAAAGADPVAEQYAARCRRYLASPPPADWDGVFAAP